jgi:hypothetical protein
MSTKPMTMTDEQLADEVARRQQQAETEQAARMERLEKARRECATTTWANRAQTEADLVQQGQDAREAFSAAVKAGDLAGAFEAWMAERTTRYAREAARNKAAGAGSLLGEDITRIPDLRWFDPDFLSRLEGEADQHARANGYDLADTLVPEAPMEVD